MSNEKKNEWLNEFKEFVSYESTSVPKDLSERVLGQIETLLNPNPLLVFLKIFGIHLVVGYLSLAVCHQFGVNPFGTSYSLADVFMNWGGHSVCMVFCGVLFSSLSLLAAGYFLTIEEIQALKRTEFLQALSLGIISLGIFAAAGAELAFAFAGLWLLGALIGGFLSIEGSLWLKVRAVKAK